MNNEMATAKQITPKMAHNIVPTQNVVKHSKVVESYEIVDVADGYMITYYHWIDVRDLCTDCVVKKKSLFDFTIEDYELLSNNSWVILLALKVDKFINIKYTIPLDDLAKGEIEYLNDVRPELFTIN